MISGLHRVPIPGLSDTSALPANSRLGRKSIYFNEPGILLGGTDIAARICREPARERSREASWNDRAFIHREVKMVTGYKQLELFSARFALGKYFSNSGYADRHNRPGLQAR
jgi:hypothetical protein